MKKKRFLWKEVLPSTLSSLLFILQILIGLYLLPKISQNEILAYTGVGFYIFSGIFFGMLPVREFRNNGSVKKGRSYIHTTKLVDTGIYAVVRHPQYITFILFSLAGILLFQHWIIIILGIPVIPLVYYDLIKADEDAIQKFGNDYLEYIEKVPRANFLLGIFRLLRNKK